jgi:MoaA/NifB/PqqE/SkfB family radical SAM enzyme
MRTEHWQAIIRQLATLGTIRFKFHGGEPTLRPDFRELSAEVKAAGMISAAVSNRLTVPSRPELLDYLDELIISLDSLNPETNDRLRGEGSYEKAMETIDLSIRRGLRTCVNMVLTRQNLPDLKAMMEFCEARGVLMNAQPVLFSRGPYSEEVPDLALAPEEIRKLHLRLAKWKRQGHGLLFSARAYQKAADWPDLEILSTRIDGKSSCVAGKDDIRIEANGDVVPCCQFEADFTPKNILKDGLEEALHHVQNHNCEDCWLPYNTERMCLFGLKLSALWGVAQREIGIGRRR